MAFRERVLMEEATWKAVVLLLKGVGNYHVIGLVEVVCNSVTVILNFCFAASITYHESLNGFWSDHSTGTASLEVKILQKAMEMREEVLYMILLDLNKVDDDLERSRLPNILKGYGVGTRYFFLL